MELVETGEGNRTRAFPTQYLSSFVGNLFLYRALIDCDVQETDIEAKGNMIRFDFPDFTQDMYFTDANRAISTREEIVEILGFLRCNPEHMS